MCHAQGLTVAQAAPWLKRLRSRWPYWGIIYDGSEWWALRTMDGRPVTLRCSSGIELETRLEEFRYAHRYAGL
ncbi:hypothetical protein [Actinomadura hibisca]|uniref:hypothetical protein n=1 Tax=Actinomadura hibisca TaxID=68565 RepID=UPI00082C3145|nr:hypothetical protein [Actinomadura hibisca]